MKPLALLVIATASAFAIDPADKTAVHNAAKDYIDALYEAKPELIERSVHPKLAKTGFWRNDQGVYKQGQMTYEQLYKLAGNWKHDEKKDLSKSPREVVVLEVLDQTASAKVIADWGIDYMHLAKFDGQWKIINILWQSPPKK